MQGFFGIINLHKPAGMTSRDAVSILSRRMRKVKLGHAGTLDPMAEGVLLVAVGAATRLIPFLQDLPKTYQAGFRFGLESDTQDITGQCTPRPSSPVEREQVERTLPAFIGTLQQTPPAFSAVKVQGKRAYKLARKGHSVDLTPRPITVHDLRLLEFSPPDWRLQIVCGKGTYVRTLGVDMARRWNASAVMTSLVRSAIGPFSQSNAVTPEQYLDGNWRDQLLNPLQAFEGWERVILDRADIIRASNGHQPELPPATPRAVALDEDGNLVAVLERVDDQLRFSANFAMQWLSRDRDD